MTKGKHSWHKQFLNCTQELFQEAHPEQHVFPTEHDVSVMGEEVVTVQPHNPYMLLLNALTAFGEEHCRQSKRKLDVLVRCMKLAFLFLCYVLEIGFINSKCY